MANNSIPEVERETLLQILSEQHDDVLRELLASVVQGAITADFDQFVGAARYERGDERRVQRNGSRERTLVTRVGPIQVDVPRAREEVYRPALLERYKRSEKALVLAVQEMVISGVSTRKVERIVKELGIANLSKSQVSVMCAGLDGIVDEFLHRPISGSYPYLMLDATYLKVRVEHRVCSQAVVIAYGVSENGVREILGLAVVASESRESWTTFLQGLRARGLAGVRLVSSDAHEGLKAAIAHVFNDAQWQRCRVHFARNVLAHVPQHRKGIVAAGMRGIYAAESKEKALQGAAIFMEEHRGLSRAMEAYANGIEDTLSFMDFPREHHRKIWSTNPIEHLNGIVKKRTKVVGIFPNPQAAIRLVTMLLIEQTEDWLTERAYMSAVSMEPLASQAPGVLG